MKRCLTRLPAAHFSLLQPETWCMRPLIPTQSPSALMPAIRSVKPRRFPRLRLRNFFGCHPGSVLATQPHAPRLLPRPRPARRHPHRRQYGRLFEVGAQWPSGFLAESDGHQQSRNQRSRRISSCHRLEANLEPESRQRHSGIRCRSGRGCRSSRKGPSALLPNRQRTRSLSKQRTSSRWLQLCRILR